MFKTVSQRNATGNVVRNVVRDVVRDVVRKAVRRAPGPQVRPGLAGLAICACTALVFGLGASVNLAVGTLATSALHPSSTEVLWIMDAYLVVFGCLLIPAGAIGDRFGRRRSMLVGLAVLAVASLASAVAPTVPLVIAARAVTGLGAALVLPSSLPLLISTHPPERRDHAVAVWTSMTGVGGVLGNVLGGVVLEFFDWQALFAVAAPIALLGGIAVAVATRPVPGQDRRLDLGGTVILVALVFALLFGIIESRELGWTSVPVLAAFAVAVLLAVGFTRYELRHPAPLLDPRVLRAPGLRAGGIGVILSFVAMYSVFYLNGQYLMSVKGYPPILAGLGTAPLAAAMFLVTPQAPRLARWLGTRVLVVAGLLTIVAGLLLFATCTPRTPYAYYALCIVIVGVGSAVSNPALSSAILSALPASQQGTGAGINSFAREIGGALGMAVFGTLVGTSFGANLAAAGPVMHDLLGATGNHDVGSLLAAAAAAPESVRATIRDAFTDATGGALAVVAGIVGVAAALIVWWLPGRSTRKRSRGASARG